MEMEYHFNEEIRQDDARRGAFERLAKETFGLSFEEWYQKGYWTEKYWPYTLFDGERAIANVSVNPMEILWRGEQRIYVQLGTVMTAPEYRHRGLMRELMEKVMADWEDRCDGMFLFANKTVLDFYPKFGFRKEPQYEFGRAFLCVYERGRGDLGIITGRPASRGGMTAQKLDMEKEESRALLKKYYGKKNPFSELQVVENFELLMFYCGAFMKDFVWYVPEYDAVMVAEQDGEILRCYDVFCDDGKDLAAILLAVAGEGTSRAELEFTPKDRTGFDCRIADEDDDTLFVLSGKENLFHGNQLKFPVISHT